jgi:hypothetical protein
MNKLVPMALRLIDGQTAPYRLSSGPNRYGGISRRVIDELPTIHPERPEAPISGVNE